VTPLGSPTRVFDTRTGGKVGAPDGTGAIRELQVTGTAGIPAGISAVAMTVTVDQTENPRLGGGYVTVFPCGTQPNTSNLNFTGGQNTANTVIAPVSATGKVCFYVYGTAHVLADIAGYFP